MELDDLIDRVATIGAIGQRKETERAIAATLSVLGERLGDDDARAVAQDLPVPLGHLILSGRHGFVFDELELYDRVRTREGVPAGFSREHAQAVCEVIGGLLSTATRARLEQHLPRAIVDLLRPVNRASMRPTTSHDARHDILATGRVGSRHPLSEARPSDAHANSVARSDDPHGTSKLSSAPGLTQESLHETLADGRPGPRRPIGEG